MGLLLATAQAEAAGSSLSATGDMLDVMVAVMFIGCGLYALAEWFRLRGAAKVAEHGRLLKPGGAETLRCRDEEAYLREMRPKVLILGIGLVLFGGCFVADHLLHGSAWVEIVLMALPLALLIWYGAQMRKAIRRWWR